jgi:hypothetical protein
MPAGRQARPRTEFDGVRVVNGDRFLLFLQPDTVTEAIAETFLTWPGSRSPLRGRPSVRRDGRVTVFGTRGLSGPT